MNIRFFAATAVACLSSSVVYAQTCGGSYTIKRGDSLSVIADRLYKDVGKWSVIHQNNIGSIGENPSAIRVGQVLRLPCLDGLPTGLAGGTQISAAATQVTAPAAPAQPEPAVVTPAAAVGLPKVKVITADDFAPFTDRKLENGGLLAELVDVAMNASVGEDGYDIYWVNDWPSHLDPLLTENVFEMAFPWSRPDCEAEPDQQRCVDYHFSEPMFEYLVMLFVDKARPIPFAKDSDIEGRTLCRPEGYLNHMLDKDGRNWLKDNKVDLVQPRSVADCFEALTAGDVDAVVINEFTGRSAVKDLDLKDKVDVVHGRPVSVTGLHVLISKQNPNAQSLLETVNDGLDKIKESGDYQRIVSTHMARIWASF